MRGMTLDQRRRRLRLGLGLCATAIGGLVVAWLAGVDRHISLISSMPLWPAVAILAGQLSSVRAKIAVHGPDAPEEGKPASRTAIAAALGVLIVVLAVGGMVALRVAI